MKICIFPNDSLLSYFSKGEIKKGYFNPKDFFEEVHVISLFDEEIDENQVQKLAGSGALKIHNIGKTNLANYKNKEERVIKLIQKINPSIIRAFNPLVQGWLAIKAGKKLHIPIVISLHTNYEQQKSESKKRGKYFRFLKLTYTANKIEKYVLKNADAVICVYEFIVDYAKKMGANNIHVIYNKIDLQQFSPNIKKKFFSKIPVILTVGRLIDQKNPKHIIEAVKNLQVELLIIGDGPNYNSLNYLVQSLELSNKVKFIKSVPHEKLNSYYVSSDIFAQPLENLGGISMPVMEAMACGLPVVMTERSESYPEIIDDAVFFVKNNPLEFQNAFKKILSDLELKNSLEKKSLGIMAKIGGDVMEKKECKLYQELLKKSS